MPRLRRQFFPLLAGLCALTVSRPVTGTLVAAAANSPAPSPPPVAAYLPPDDPAELLEVDADMHRFFAQRIPSGTDRVERLHAIVDAIMKPDGLGFTYESEATYDARETFRRRSGNCVGFSVMAVAVLRHFGLDARFQTLSTESRWERFGQIIASVQHMNVLVRTRDASYLIDIRADAVPIGRSAEMAVVADERAFADFYSNIGFFRLVHGDHAGALASMIKATSVDASHAGAWANRANIHARLGELENARVCFERSMRADSTLSFALANYVEVLRRLGTPADLKTAAKLERRAQRLRDRNPYYQQFLARTAYARGELGEADKLLRRAIDLKEDEPEFYTERIGILSELGRARDAEWLRTKLVKLQRRLAHERSVPPSGPDLHITRELHLITR